MKGQRPWFKLVCCCHLRWLHKKNGKISDKCVSWYWGQQRLALASSQSIGGCLELMAVLWPACSVLRACAKHYWLGFSCGLLFTKGLNKGSEVHLQQKRSHFGRDAGECIIINIALFLGSHRRNVSFLLHLGHFKTGIRESEFPF